MKKSLSIRAKLILANCLLALLFAGVVIFSVVSMGRMVDEARASFSVSKATSSITTMKSNLVRIELQKKLFIEAIEDGKSPNLEDFEMDIDAVEEGMFDFSGEVFDSPDLKEISAEMEAHWNDKLRPALDAFIEGLEAGETEAKDALGNAERALEEFQAIIEKAEARSAPIFQRAFDTSIWFQETGMMLQGGLALIGAIAILLMMVHFTRLSNSMLASTNQLEKMSFEVKKQSRDVKDASEKVATASTQTSSSIQETVATIAEIKAMMNKATEFVGLTRDKSEDSERRAQEGLHEMHRLSDSINSISAVQQELNEKIDFTTEQIHEINKIFEDIKSKTDIINDIVFQTKLLSFNASVEAARAGEHGKGFAIVAEEVGTLAKVSGESSKEIAEILEASSNKVDSIVNEINREVRSVIDSGNQKIGVGLELSELCKNKLSAVSENVSEVKGMMDEIDATSREQTEGVDNINIAMDEIDTATHMNNDAANQSSGSAEILSARSDDLLSVVVSLAGVITGDRKLDQEKAVDGAGIASSESPSGDSELNNDAVVRLAELSPKAKTKGSLDAPPSADHFDDEDLAS